MHEFVPPPAHYPGHYCRFPNCSLPIEHPVHQRETSEETAPAATCTHEARAVTADGRLWACSYCGVTGTDEPSAGRAAPTQTGDTADG